MNPNDALLGMLKHWEVSLPLFLLYFYTKIFSGDSMRLVEEIYMKADRDEVCQKCGVDIHEGTNHLLETYIHKGTLLVNTYCLSKKCNPPNNVRLRLFWGTVILSLATWAAWGLWFKA